MKIKSKLDCITNSSSEVFCTITNPDPEKLEDLYYELLDITGPRQEDEYTVYVSLNEDNEIKITFPYNFKEGIRRFWKYGLDGIIGIKDFEGTEIKYETNS